MRITRDHNAESTVSSGALSDIICPDRRKGDAIGIVELDQPSDTLTD